jgi:hypothetical protein
VIVIVIHLFAGSKFDITEVDPDISIRGAHFFKEKNQISKQFVLRKIKR